MPGCLECNECTNYGEETACLSPYNLTFTDITNSSLTLSWVGSDNVVNYSIEFKESTEVSWNILTPVAAPITTATIVGLSADTTYDFRINAVCAASSCYSLTVRKKTIV